jgi:hypothetical protein
MGSIGNNLSSSYLQSVISGALQGTGQSNQTKPNQADTVDPASLSSGDHSQLSPFAQILSTLQQLQQSNPAQYQQVTQQIATNLHTAAKTAQAAGNLTAASQLNQLATDFTQASQSGQLPNIQDLAQATGGHHHHHHGGHGHGAPPPSATDPLSSVSSSNSGTAGSGTAGGGTAGNGTAGGDTSSNGQAAGLLPAGVLGNGDPRLLTSAGIILTTLADAGLADTGLTGAGGV